MLVPLRLLPPGKADPQPQPSVARARQPRAWSVHRERAGRV